MAGPMSQKKLLSLAGPSLFGPEQPNSLIKPHNFVRRPQNTQVVITDIVIMLGNLRYFAYVANNNLMLPSNIGPALHDLQALNRSCMGHSPSERNY